MKKLLFLLVLAVMCSSVVIADDLKDVLNGVKADQKESYTRYLAEQGDADAQYYLGVMYSAGEGVKQDYILAHMWYNLAASNGNENGRVSRDLVALEMTPAQISKAQKIFEFCKNQKHCDYIARDIHDGREAFKKEDYANAAGLKLLRPLAKQGDVIAQFALSRAYFFGKGVTQNYQEAAKWMLKAAKQGNADAQNILGSMYREGQGVIKDYKEAAKWYRLAAGQGNANSQFSLGFMYSNGQGVIRDLVLAHIWYNLAASNGSERGKKSRDFIALGMDFTQISKAQDMARDCLIKKYKNCDFSSAVYSEEPKVDAINEEKIALACSGKHPQRNIQNTVLFLIDRKKDVLQESRYCGSFEDVDIVLGSVKDNQLVWYSASPFVRNAYGEKILNLKKLKFEYRRTWRRSHEKGGAVRGERSWSAQCNIIDWEDAIELRKKLRC